MGVENLFFSVRQVLDSSYKIYLTFVWCLVKEWYRTVVKPQFFHDPLPKLVEESLKGESVDSGRTKNFLTLVSLCCFLCKELKQLN